MDERIGLLELFVKFRAKRNVVALVFLLSMCVFVLAIFSGPDTHQYQSVYEVGYRDLNVPLERVDLIVERMSLIELPMLVAEYGDVNVDVFNVLGSRLIRLSSKASIDNEATVHRVHLHAMERLDALHAATFKKLESAYTSQRNSLARLLSDEDSGLSDAKRINYELGLVRLERQIAHLSPSKIHFVAKPVSGRLALSKGRQLSAAIVFSLLLSLLAGGVALFIQALRARLA